MIDRSGQTDDVRSFGEDLRALRRRSGAPSFRAMAQRAHFSSSTLAEATQGRRLPSEVVVRAFVEACSADPGPWLARWRQLADAAREAAPAPASDFPTFPSGEALTPAAVRPADQRPADQRPADGPTAEEKPPRAAKKAASAVSGLHRAIGGLGPRARLNWLLVAVTALSAAGGAAADATTTGEPPAALAPAAGSDHAGEGTVPTDGADPGGAGCALDATVLAHSALIVQGRPAGMLELRYSARCRAGWSRFVLDRAAAPGMADVQLQSEDGRASSFTYRAVIDLPVYTDLLHPDGSCLRGVVSMVKDGQMLTAVTPCVLPSARSTPPTSPTT